MAETRNLRLKLEAATGGEAYRTVAIGTYSGEGFNLSRMAEGQWRLPTELLDALHRYLQEFQPSVGTWNHTVGDTNYQVSFTPAST